ncbi:MAG: asparagine synthetase B [Pyrinomonadaceae bacterium]
MSGIVGIVNLDGAPVDRDLLSHLARNVWIDGDVGFGGTDTWITADARIDGWPDTDLTDVERIVCAYETWGDECVEHLIGDFAFAIWDKRRKRLFCARDHFGVKPFFYSRVGNSFIFSSTLNVLRRDARVSDDLNETAVNDYLEHGLNQDLSTTIFRDIQRLPGGHTLTIANGSVTTRRYWTPEIKNEVRFRDPQSYVERFNELLTAATKDRLRTNRVSISMSGGLDSTSLAVIARDLLQETSGPAAVQAVTVVYDELIPDQERHYSTLAASSLGIPIQHVKGDDYTLFEERRADDLDQPEPFLLSPFAGQFNDSLRLMASHSNVALTGYDGDALMNEPQRSLIARVVRSLGVKNKEADSKKGQFHSQRSATFKALQSKVWAPLFEGYDPGSTRLQLEVRHPFIDVRLVDYVLSIPAHPWCTNKHILRRAMKHRLPADIVNRPKTPLDGDPALQLMRRASVRWRDSFEVTPKLERFVNLSHRRSLADENTPDAVWAKLRLFALNHWLAHSLPRDRQMVA